MLTKPNSCSARCFVQQQWLPESILVSSFLYLQFVRYSFGVTYPNLKSIISMIIRWPIWTGTWAFEHCLNSCLQSNFVPTSAISENGLWFQPECTGIGSDGQVGPSPRAFHIALSIDCHMFIFGGRSGSKRFVNYHCMPLSFLLVYATTCTYATVTNLDLQVGRLLGP